MGRQSWEVKAHHLTRALGVTWGQKHCVCLHVVGVASYIAT
ncbi:hypothetical protein DGo_PE0046 (plasmid) [Deinococcus gobiensis I-0]|uniref:Uncharacterized protein n=1 Tax=Deinococcus gobiensis (strain DSM 21396 / JCM 16679 / CGMCC 1.7299 / I-0) TaxID=745776 RepID=H8H3U3_DEIGI|nr:hypothetical protein DGo_PE0046 [Deinococcus gobiensis I-0]